MFHYFNTVTDDKGNSLPGFQVEVVQLADGQTVVPIFADENSTPIQTVSGVANRAVADAAGNYDFFVNEGTYSLRFYDAKGGFLKSQRFLPLYGAEQVTNVLSNAPVVDELLGTDQIPIVRGGVVDVISANDFAQFFNFGPPVFETSPSISGLAEVGEVLSANDGTVSGGSITGRNWLKDGGVLVGETNTTYTIIADDEGSEISLQVSASGPFGNASATSSAVGPVTSAALQPGSNWNGAVDSGFSGGEAAPVDPVRTVAKPAARFIVPPAQTFTDDLLVIVRAEALNAGTLIDGVQKVRFNYEGAAIDVADAKYHDFTDANGNPVSYLGYAVTLKKPSGTQGEARLFAEVVPSDPAMQSRVLQMTTFPKDSQYEVEVTVDPDQPEVESVNYQTITNALRAAVVNGGSDSVRITVVKTGDYEIDRPGALDYQTGSYIVIDAAAGVTCTIKRPVADFGTLSMRPRIGALWFKGENIVFDFSTWCELYKESTGNQTILDGVTITNSNGRDSLFLGGTPPGNQWRFRGTALFMECDSSEVEDVYRNGFLVRGCAGENLSGDIFSGAKCVVNCNSVDFSSQYFRTPEDAFTILYTGTGSGTVTLTGISDASNRELRLRVNGSTLATYAMTQSNTIQEVIAFVNGETDWTATEAVPASQRRATSLTAQGTPAFGSFSDADATSAALQMVAAFDLHEDFYASGGGVQENIIFAENLGYNTEGAQLFHLKDATDFYDGVIVNNAVHPSGATLDFSNLQSVFSHFAFAHNSVARQTLRMFTGSGRDFDTRCVIANNAMQSLAWNGSPDSDLIIDSNHTATAAPSGATNHTTGGSTSTLWADVESGDFTPTGELLTNLKTPVFELDLNGEDRAASDAAGAIKS